MQWAKYGRYLDSNTFFLVAMHALALLMFENACKAERCMFPVSVGWQSYGYV
jgi:hypothetical protein